MCFDYSNIITQWRQCFISKQMLNKKHWIFPDFVTVIFLSTEPFSRSISLLHLMHVIECAHANTLATTLMFVKNNMHHFCLWHLLSRILGWRKWKKDKNIKLNSWSFFFNLVTLLLAWILHFHVWHHNKGEILFGVNNQFGIYQTFLCILLRTMAKQLK